MIQPITGSAGAESDRAQRVTEAKRRARHVLQSASHASVPGEVAGATRSAMGVVIGVVVVWVLLTTGGAGVATARLTAVAGVGFALAAGISEGLRVRARLGRLERELERERREIRDDREHECDEVRVLYEAKGFSEPLLGQVVDTLCADDERLLKVMMHEELGLATEQLEHPVTVGVITTVTALGSAAVVTAAVGWLPPAAQAIGVPAVASIWITVLAWLRSQLTDHDVVDLMASWLLAATVVVGTVYFLARLSVETG